MTRLGHAILSFLAIPAVIVISAVLYVLLASLPLFAREVALGIAFVLACMAGLIWLFWTGRLDTGGVGFF